MDSQPEAAGLRQRGDLNPGLSTFASCKSDRGECAELRVAAALWLGSGDWRAGPSRREL